MVAVGKKRNMYPEPQISVKFVPACCHQHMELNSKRQRRSLRPYSGKIYCV